MVNNTVFVDILRQEEIEMFYKVAQLHREYYKGYAKSYHPYTYFREPQYIGQCPGEMTSAYLSYPSYHIKYKHPSVLPVTFGRTTVFPQLPDRNLGGRFNKQACKKFIR